MNVIEINKNLIDRYFNEAWNNGKLKTLDDIISKNYINHSPGLPNPTNGPEGLKPVIESMRKAFPDLNYKIENLVLSEQQVAVHTTMRGTHLGDFFGLPATGNKVEVSQMQIEKIEDGKIIEHWRITDDKSLMEQLKVVK